MQIDTIQNLPEELKGTKELEYDLVLAGILTEAQFEKDKKTKEKELAKNVEKGIKRAEKVTKDTKKVIEDFKSNKLGSKLVKTSSGLQYLITKSGKGGKAESGSTVTVQYLGALMNGDSFDDSFSRGMEPFSFKIGEGMVIPGWEEGLTYFREGDKGYIFIPSKLAYGEEAQGEAIPPNSDLVFYIEMEKVTKE
jgi:FKBP-type peptidyl-prolyl cis-trans isomerase